MLGCAAFSLVCALFSTTSAKAVASGLGFVAFPDRSACADTPGVSRFSCMLFFDVLGVSDYAGPGGSSRFERCSLVSPSRRHKRVGTRNEIYEAQYPAHRCLCLRFNYGLTTAPAKLDVRMVRYSFPVRLLHSQPHAGLSRRSDIRPFAKHILTDERPLVLSFCSVDIESIPG